MRNNDRLNIRLLIILKIRGEHAINAYIVKEGYFYILTFAIITIISAALLPLYYCIIPGVLILYITFFFRNPKRTILYDNSLILSPADGKVMSIEEIFEDRFLNAQAIKVSIFLSIFDVHVNRSPMEGEIKYQQYTCGRFKPAYKESAPFQNERHTIGLDTGKMKIMVTQVAGILARRIISWVALGTQLQQGQRYGMIKFGSCTEVIVPLNVDILVTKGDRVKGGKSIIGKIIDNTKTSETLH